MINVDRPKKLLVFVLFCVALFSVAGGLFQMRSTMGWLKSKSQKSTAPCVNRLRVIYSAKQQWLLEHEQDAAKTID